MANFGTILKQLRQRDKITQVDLAAKLQISRSTISMYETDERQPDFETLEAIADIFNVDMNYLLGKSGSENKDFYTAKNIIPLPTMKEIPLLGTIACGEPILAAENLNGNVYIPDYIHADFALRCKGDSMINARIFDGDLVYIKQQDSVDNGEIAAVLIDDEATLKKVFYQPGKSLTLRACNPTFPDLEYFGAQLDEIKILGKAVFFVSQIRG